jgi:Rrf2 family protein
MFSQTIEYALRAMVHLASAPQDASLNSETLAQRTKVPKGYLSKIMRDLVVAELVNSQRGPNGGFTLGRLATKISILDIVDAVDPLQRITKCPLGNPLHVKLCPLHSRLDNALAMIQNEFRNTSLAEVLETNTRAGAQCGALVTPTVRAS